MTGTQLPEKLTPREEACLKVTKEIVVKYIELGRLGMGNFSESFARIYQGVRNALQQKSE
jgi:hypothetical protein